MQPGGFVCAQVSQVKQNMARHFQPHMGFDLDMVIQTPTSAYSTWGGTLLLYLFTRSRLLPHLH